MPELAAQKCVPCRAGEPPLAREAIEQQLAQLPGWEVVEVDGVPRLRKTYTFPSYKDAVAFVNRVAEEADRQDHHPVLVLEWGRVTVSWWTHAIRGLHQNDFIMAARSERLTS